MLHLGIDLHQAQITIVLLDEGGETIRRSTVSTDPATIDSFLAAVNAQSRPSGGYRAILETCGFTHWLIERLKAHECRDVVLVQPLKRTPHKTDKRDAASLAELLWLNRERLSTGARVHGIRQVIVPTESDRQSRLLTNTRISLTRERTRVINRLKAILRQFNLVRACPTKGIQTKAARAWCRDIELPKADRILLDLALERWALIDQQIDRLQREVDECADNSPAVQVLRTIPGFGNLTALTIVSRIGSIDRFSRPASLANMFGLTPTINDSGETTGRLGNITKLGHPNVRYLLGQSVQHVLRKDRVLREVYRKIRKRRGAKTALVALMRRIMCRIWHMLRTGEAYRLPVATDAPAAVSVRS